MQKLKNKKPELKEEEPVEIVEESPPVSGQDLMARRNVMGFNLGAF